MHEASHPVLDVLYPMLEAWSELEQQLLAALVDDVQGQAGGAGGTGTEGVAAAEVSCSSELLELVRAVTVVLC